MTELYRRESNGQLLVSAARHRRAPVRPARAARHPPEDTHARSGHRRGRRHRPRRRGPHQAGRYVFRDDRRRAGPGGQDGSERRIERRPGGPSCRPRRENNHDQIFGGSAYPRRDTLHVPSRSHSGGSSRWVRSSTRATARKRPERRPDPRPAGEAARRQGPFRPRREVGRRAEAVGPRPAGQPHPLAGGRRSGPERASGRCGRRTSSCGRGSTTRAHRKRKRLRRGAGRRLEYRPADRQSLGEHRGGDDVMEKERKPLTPPDFEAAAAIDQEAADERRRENGRLKAEWMERNRKATLGWRIHNRLLRVLRALL